VTELFLEGFDDGPVEAHPSLEYGPVAKLKQLGYIFFILKC
jgi:hypothetical protein